MRRRRYPGGEGITSPAEPFARPPRTTERQTPMTSEDEMLRQWIGETPYIGTTGRQNALALAKSAAYEAMQRKHKTRALTIEDDGRVFVTDPHSLRMKQVDKVSLPSDGRAPLPKSEFGRPSRFNEDHEGRETYTHGDYEQRLAESRSVFAADLSNDISRDIDLALAAYTEDDIDAMSDEEVDEFLRTFAPDALEVGEVAQVTEEDIDRMSEEELDEFLRAFGADDTTDYYDEDEDEAVLVEDTDTGERFTVSLAVAQHLGLELDLSNNAAIGESEEEMLERWINDQR